MDEKTPGTITWQGNKYEAEIVFESLKVDYRPILKIEKIRGNARTLLRREGDAGYDLYAALTDSLVIDSFTSALIPIGIKTSFSSRWVGLLRERGSTGTKNIKVNAGVIDSSYRGEWFVCLYNANPFPIALCPEPEWRMDEYEEDGIVCYSTKNAIAQVIFTESVDFSIDVVDSISDDTMRGEGKLGSTNDK